MDPLVVVFGFGVGVLVGLTGIGGGALMTPLLILVFGVKPVTAIGTDLAYGAVTKTVGGWKHFRQGTVDFGLSTWMAAGSMPAAVLGTVALRALERASGQEFDDIVLVAVAAAILLTGTLTLTKSLLVPASRGDGRQSAAPTRANKVKAGILGALVGFVLGITSAGSGSLIAVGLILLFGLAPHRVVGTDVFHAAMVLWAAALAHLVAGNVDFALAGTILLGSVPGVWIGSHLSVRTPVATLRTTLGIVLIGGGLGLLSKAGLGIPAELIAVVPVLAALVVGRAFQLSRREPAPSRPAPAPR